MAARGELIPRGGSDARRALTKARRVVVKVGSNLVTAPGLGSDPDRIERLAADVAAVRQDREVALVSSGAIATGMARLALAERLPDRLGSDY